MGSLIRLFGQLNPLSIYKFGCSFAEDAGGDGGGGGASASAAPETPPAQSNPDQSFSWKSQIASDFANSPTLKTLPDTKEGLDNAMKGYLSLEKMLGHEKVPVPKGPEDKEAWAMFSKALGIPDKAEQYGLPDVEVPDNLKDLSFNKQEFAEVMHAHKLTPGQAKGLWETFASKLTDTYQKAVTEKESHMTDVVNRMKSEWGDAYDTNVSLGQKVINKFSSDSDMENWLSVTLASDPRGIKFLSKVGSQFAENKIGDFNQERFSLSPDQAQAEIDSILKDEKHPYNNDKALPQERDRAIDYVNRLYAVKVRTEG